MRRWAVVGVAIWLVGLVACGTAVTPTASPLPSSTVVTGGGTGATPTVPATRPAAVTPSRASAPALATPAAATPTAMPGATSVADWPGNTFLQLLYQGRSYLGFWSQPTTNGPVVPAGAGVPELGPPVGRTFSRWQSGNLTPAGTAIRSVVGQPPERMLAIAVAEGTVFYRSVEDSDELARLSVVIGTVREQGEPRWGTPDGSPPPDGDGIYYAPFRLEGVRTIQGQALVTAGSINLRLFIAPPGGSNAAAMQAELGELPTLQPGDSLLAFLWMGGDPLSSVMSDPGSWFHWTTPNRLYALRDGMVSPLAIPADAGLPGLSEGEFLAGVDDAFRGVIAIDPRDPIPTRLSQPTAPAPPRIEVGQPINLTQQHALAGTEWIDVARYSDPRNRYPIVATDRVAAIVAALDQPLAVAAILPQKPPPPDDPRTLVNISFQSGMNSLLALEYDTVSGMLYARDNYARRFSLPAPPDFARLLGLE